MVEVYSFSQDLPVTIGFEAFVPMGLYGRGPDPGFFRNLFAGLGELGNPSLLAELILLAVSFGTLGLGSSLLLFE